MIVCRNWQSYYAYRATDIKFSTPDENTQGNWDHSLSVDISLLHGLCVLQGSLFTSIYSIIHKTFANQKILMHHQTRSTAFSCTWKCTSSWKRPWEQRYSLPWDGQRQAASTRKRIHVSVPQFVFLFSSNTIVLASSRKVSEPDISTNSEIPVQYAKSLTA